MLFKKIVLLTPLKYTFGHVNGPGLKGQNGPGLKGRAIFSPQEYECVFLIY